nr:hypothetical protein [Tanacetum cinerariifolium]
MDTTIDQQVAMDEALVPHAQRLRIGRSNFRLLSDIKSKESTLQLDPSIPRRNKVNWHYVRDDQMFFTIKLVSKHQNMQQFGALLPIELTNKEIRNSNAYKEYYAIATGAAPPKPKASVRRTRSSFDTSIIPPTAAASPRLTASAKGKQIAKASKAENDDGEEGNANDDDQEVERDDDKDDEEEGNYDKDLSLNVGGEEGHVEEEEEDDLYRDSNINQGRGVQATLEVEDSHVILTLVNPDEANFSKAMQTNQFAGAVSAIPRIIQRYMDQRMNEAVKVAVQIQSDRLRDEAQRENDEFLKTVDENMQKIIKEQVKEQVKVQVSNILPRIEQIVNEQLEAEVLTRSSYSSRTSYAVVADLSEIEQKKILIEKMEGNKSIQRSDEQRNLYKALVETYESDKIILDTYEKTATLKRHRDDDADKDEEPSAGPDRGSKRRREGKEPESASVPTEIDSRSAGRSTQGSQSPQASASESIQTWISELAKRSDSRSSFNELMDTPLDFSNFLINRLKVDTLTPKLLAGLIYELMKGSCKSLVELEYHLEEVFKATTYQLDWVNPKGQQYPHNLLKPLPLIPNNRGRRVIPFEYFINNDLEYLRGEDLVPRRMWIEEPIGYDKHALWGVSYWGRKRQQFYGFVVNQESARDVYSKRRIIAITELKIVEWHNYKHLDWITVRRDDDKLYKFKEGNFKRLCIQDIKDMLLLLVQGMLTNLIGYPLVSVEVLRYDKRSKSENIGIVPTVMELILEHTQQGISHEVSMEILLEPTSNKFMVGQSLQIYRKLKDGGEGGGGAGSGEVVGGFERLEFVDGDGVGGDDGWVGLFVLELSMVNVHLNTAASDPPSLRYSILEEVDE